MDKTTLSIYAIRNKANGRVYIGKTKDIRERVLQHWAEKTHIANIYKQNQLTRELTLYEKDYLEAGKDGFEVYCLEENVPQDIGREREAYWIAEYDATNPKYGYNKRSERKLSVNCIVGLPPNVSKGEKVEEAPKPPPKPQMAKGLTDEEFEKVIEFIKEIKAGKGE